MPIAPGRRTRAADQLSRRRQGKATRYFLGRSYELYATRFGVGGRPAPRRSSCSDVG
jgi:hypothetical protein